MATTGSPIALASIAARGKPSRCDASTKMSMAAYSAVDVVAMTEEPNPVFACTRDFIGAERIGLVGIGRAHHHEDEAVAG